MYKQFFGLRANPFNVNPDPRFIFVNQGVREALACLSCGIQMRKGFMLLTGEVGTGKTMLINKLLDWLRANSIATAFVFNPRLNSTEFLDYVMGDFEIAGESHDKGQLLFRLNRWLLDQYRVGKTAVLIIDEAQNLSADLLEEIRLLTNMETPREKLLQIVLSGQPELEEKIRQPQLRQLRQRITLRSKTHPLTLAETNAYIAHRLTVAGAKDASIFQPDAVQAVFKHSQGIARIINVLCEHSMINAFVEGKRTIGADLVDDVATEFELTEVPTRVAPSTMSSADNVSIEEAVKTFAARRHAKRQALYSTETLNEKRS